MVDTQDGCEGGVRCSGCEEEPGDGRPSCHASGKSVKKVIEFATVVSEDDLIIYTFLHSPTSHRTCFRGTLNPLVHWRNSFPPILSDF